MVKIENSSLTFNNLSDLMPKLFDRNCLKDTSFILARGRSIEPSRPRISMEKGPHVQAAENPTTEGQGGK
jgi:hypothetical protein